MSIRFVGGRGNLQVAQEDTGDPFVDQDAPVLRVIAELHDVEMAVLGLYEVRLRAAAHFPNESVGLDGHRRDAGRAAKPAADRANLNYLRTRRNTNG
jgi:hypothetical protein